MNGTQEFLINRITFSSFQEFCSEVPKQSVSLVVTSPPYWLEKSYEKLWSWEEYENLMYSFYRACEYVVKPGGYIVVNFGDYFNSGNRFYNSEVPTVFPASVYHYQWGRAHDFDLQSTRIWRKQFARMGIPFVCNDHPRHVFDYEHVWTWRIRNGSRKEIVNDRKLSQRGVIGEDWKSSARNSIHEAAFPIELPEWAIKVYSQPGDIVFDPFAGIGTTALACIRNDRIFIGCDIIEKYVDYGNKQIEQELELGE